MGNFTKLMGAAVLLSTGLVGCNQPVGGALSVWSPDPDTIQFEAVLSKDSNFTIDGDITIPRFGDVYFMPASGNKGFTFGGRLDWRVFLPESWSIGEVTRLPTGAFFPAWVRTALVEVSTGQDFKAYVGVRGTRYLGVGWGFLKSKDMPVGIGATYYDDAGNVVMGGLFYPPKVVNGAVTVPGGLFIATNLSMSTASNKLNAEGMLTSFGQSSVKMGERTLKASYFTFDKQGRTHSMKASDVKIAQRYQEELKKASEQAHNLHQLRAE